MKDKLREEIAKTLFDWIDDDGWEWWEVDEAVKNHYRHKADSILSLIAPELDAARKWDEVIKISKSLKVLCTSCNYSVICEKSPSYLCDAARDLVIAVFDALSKEVT